MSRLKAGDLVQDLLTGELFILLELGSKEHWDGTAENVWKILYISKDTVGWIWEYILDDEQGFMVQ